MQRRLVNVYVEQKIREAFNEVANFFRNEPLHKDEHTRYSRFQLDRSK